MTKALLVVAAASLFCATAAFADTRAKADVDQRVGVPIDGDDGAGIQRSLFGDTTVDGRTTVYLQNGERVDMRARYGSDNYSVEQRTRSINGPSVSERRVAGGTEVKVRD